jgi:hypothetical protein
VRRREVLLALPAFGLSGRAHADDTLVAALRAGGVALLLRHALTEPGIGDPPGFRPGVCATQRQLSEQGRAQAQRIGAWFASRGLNPAAVRSSAWCRCLDTATLAFGRAPEPWRPLDSLFGPQRPSGPSKDAAVAALHAGLARVGRAGFEVWVTHQVNVTAFMGEGVAMGAAWAVRAAPGRPGRVHNLGRLSFDA